MLLWLFREQEMVNLIHQKRYTEAIEVAIALDQPYRICKMIQGGALMYYFSSKQMLLSSS